MPRKKTIQPRPLESFELEDGTLVEIRDPTCWEIGRGRHKSNKFILKLDDVLAKVVDDYIRAGKVVPKYLKNASVFARHAELTWGLSGPDGVDDSALRKKLYPAIVNHLKGLKIL